MVTEVQRQLPRNIPQISEMSDDDDLLMSIDLEHHVHSSEASTSNRPADLLIDDNDDDLLSVDPDELLKNLQQSNRTTNVDAFCESIDYDIAVDLTDIETQTLVTSNEPIESIEYEGVQPNQFNNIEADTLEATPTILDSNYPYTFCGFPVVTIDQLMEIEDYSALQGRHFFFKADISTVYERLHITIDILWSIGVVLSDSSAKVLKVNNVLFQFVAS